MTTRTNKMYRRKRVNFLRIYPLIREAIAAVKGIKKSDIDVILYLDDLVYFTKKQFKSGIYWGGWDLRRFNRLEDNELIDRIPGTGTGKGNPTRYKLALKGRTMVTNIYKMCYEEKEIPESTSINPIMRRKTFRHNKMATFIINHNKNLKNERRKTFGNE